MRAVRGAPPSGVLRTSRFFPEETVMFLFGEICLACGWEGHGSRTEVHRESRGITAGPYRLFLAARPAVTQGVTGQKSADGIIAKRPP